MQERRLHVEVLGRRRDDGRSTRRTLAGSRCVTTVAPMRHRNPRGKPTTTCSPMATKASRLRRPEGNDPHPEVEPGRDLPAEAHAGRRVAGVAAPSRR